MKSLAIFSALLLGFSSRSEAKIENVLFIVADDLKASVLGCYGDPICKTPHLNALAKQSMIFERAYCQGTWCAPSRTSFMHSRYRGSNGPTIGQHLISHGYHSARVGKIFHMRVPGDIIAGTDGNDVPETWTERFNCQGEEAHTPGLYRLLNKNIETRELEGRQSTQMPHRMFASVESDGDGSEQPDWKAADKAIELLKRHAEEKKPFFLAVGFVRPHYPSVAPASYFKPYPHEKIPLPEVPESDMSDIPKIGRAGTTSENCGIARYPDNIRQMWSDYYATVTFMDEQLGKITRELDRLGLRESTLVIFTSDHGYHLGEHDFWQKVTFHEEVTRVPLLVSAPGFESGRTFALAELVDLFPSICDLLGLPTPATLQGRSLRPVLSDPKATVRNAAMSLDPRKGHAIRTSGWTYMRYKNGDEELYDMKNDPEQFRNLANSADHAEKRKQLSSLLGERINEIAK